MNQNGPQYFKRSGKLLGAQSGVMALAAKVHRLESSKNGIQAHSTLLKIKMNGSINSKKNVLTGIKLTYLKMLQWNLKFYW